MTPFSNELLNPQTMNVSLRHFIAFWFLLFSSFALHSQAIVLETYQNTSLVHPITSSPFGPQITDRPENGTARLVDKGNSKFELIYEPNGGFIGADELEFSYWVSPPTQYKRVTVYINVLPSVVKANTDFAGTPANIAVDIDVLGNDEATSGNLTISNISLINNGEVIVSEDGGLLTFVPEADFQGIAHFNYIACDASGVCDQGAVSINVYGENTSDTLTIFTKKNQPQSIFVPKNFSVVEYPFNGFYDDYEDIPVYYPDMDFVGTDYIVFENNGMSKVAQIVVLDMVDNTFANDDEVSTTSFSPVEFNVLENDLYGINAGCFSFEQPLYGTLEAVDENGTFVYTPAEGFIGVDQFTYTSNDPGCAFGAETATVFVKVSNFEPVYNRFRMSTVKGTPLIVAYSIPIAEYRFEISEQPTLGQVIFMEGQADTTINGQRIRGYNLLIYVPNNGVNEGQDEFELNYCVTSGDQCRYEKYLKIEMDILDLGDGNEAFCFNDCVWAGDTNLDGIVNIQDILPLGLYMGESGPDREEASYDAWYGEYSDNWGMNSDFNDKDIKHVDADGEGLITALDTSKISANYGRTHSLTPKSLPNYKNTIVLKGATTASPGDVIEFDIYMGTETAPAEDVYGFTFPIQYNPAFFDPKGMNVSFDDNSWLTYSSGTLTMVKNDLNGTLDAGYTRTNGLSASGFGKIGTLSVVIIDDLDGIRPGEKEITVHLGGNALGSVSNSLGQISGVKIEGLDITIDLTKPTDEELAGDTPEEQELLLKAFPNPTFNELNVHFNRGREFERIQLFNITGQMLYDSGRISGNTQTIDMSGFNPGMYILSVQTPAGVINRKIEKVN